MTNCLSLIDMLIKHEYSGGLTYVIISWSSNLYCMSEPVWTAHVWLVSDG